MAGVPGFEPGHDGIKIRCLTAWLYPNNGATDGNRTHTKGFGDLYSTVELCPCKWWRMTGSNRRPPACKAGALPAELILRYYNSLATSYSRRGKPPTTIGAKELNFCVRHGNRCDLFAIITRLSYKDVRTYALQHGCCELSVSSLKELFFQNWINMDMKVYLVKSSTY